MAKPKDTRLPDRKLIMRDISNGYLTVAWYPREQRDNRLLGRFSIEYYMPKETLQWSTSAETYLDYLVATLPRYLARRFPGNLAEVLDALKEIDPAFEKEIAKMGGRER